MISNIYCTSELERKLNQRITLSALRSGCKLLRLHCIGRTTFFIPRSNLEEAILKEELTKYLTDTFDIVVMYEKLDKKHSKLSYYNVYAVEGADWQDILKILKVNEKIKNLKAFL